MEEQWRNLEESSLKRKILIEDTNIYWEKWGEGPQIVVCLGGVLGDIAGTFHPMWEKMNGNKFTLVGIDLPGYGNSCPPFRNYRLEEEWTCKRDARIVGNLMEKLGYLKYSIVGHSGGGLVATLVAVERPQAVEKVVLCNTPFSVDRHMLQVIKGMRDINYWPRDQREYLLKKYEKPYLDKIMVDWAAEVSDELRTGGRKREFINDMINFKSPSLAFVGLKDAIVKPYIATVALEYIPHLKIHKVPNGQHSHLSFLDEFVRVTEEFLGS